MHISAQIISLCESISSPTQNVIRYASKGNIVTASEIEKLSKMYSVSPATISDLSDLIYETFQIAINIHLLSNQELYDNLYQEGILKNQFQVYAEKNVRAGYGSLQPVKGRERDEWERSMFRGLLHKTRKYTTTLYDEPLPLDIAKQRPIYGYMYRPWVKDEAIEYGNVVLLLDSDVKNRCTVTLGNSAYSNTLFTPKANLPLIQFILQNSDNQIEERVKQAINQKNLTPLEPYIGSKKISYIEVQIFNGVDLASDVQKIILKESALALEIIKLKKLCLKYGIPLSIIRKVTTSIHLFQPLTATIGFDTSLWLLSIIGFENNGIQCWIEKDNHYQLVLLKRSSIKVIRSLPITMFRNYHHFVQSIGRFDPHTIFFDPPFKIPKLTYKIINSYRTK